MEDELNDFEKAIVSLSWLATKCNYRDKLFIVKRVADIEKVIRLSQESEQLRKERDEYKHKYELTRAGCKNTDIKGNKNGNA